MSNGLTITELTLQDTAILSAVAMLVTGDGLDDEDQDHLFFEAARMVIYCLGMMTWPNVDEPEQIIDSLKSMRLDIDKLISKIDPQLK